MPPPPTLSGLKCVFPDEGAVDLLPDRDCCALLCTPFLLLPPSVQVGFFSVSVLPLPVGEQVFLPECRPYPVFYHSLSFLVHPVT